MSERPPVKCRVWTIGVLAPILLVCLGVVRAESQTVTLAWDPNRESDLGGYLIGCGTLPGVDQRVLDVGTATQWTVDGLAAGTTYYFRIYAYNTSGLRSAPSNEVWTSLEGAQTSSPSTSPPSAEAQTSSATTQPSSGTATSSSSCSTPDPFAAMGGGTCYNGGWLPPGMVAPTTTTTTSTSTATQPVASPAPLPVHTCSTPDPFAAMGGGTCYNDGWLPPGMPVPGRTSATQPAPPPAPSSIGTCSTPDPFAAMGGGTCYNGGWLPPGMPVPAGTTATPTTTAPASSAVPTGCSTPDPFLGIAGLVGVCSNGGWIPVPGVRTTGTILYVSSGGFWGIRGDDGTIYRPLAELAASLRQNGLAVAFQGRLAGEVMIPYLVALIEITALTVQ